MYELFGEFDSVEELNAAAEGFKNEGDFDSLYKMAEENGIESAFVDMYKDDAIPELCDVAMCAIAKITKEDEEVKTKEIINDWMEYVKSECMENEDLARAVRKKGKSLKKCIAHIIKWAFNNRYPISEEIRKAAGINANVGMGMPGAAKAKKLIREYYMGNKAI